MTGLELCLILQVIRVSVVNERGSEDILDQGLR